MKKAEKRARTPNEGSSVGRFFQSLERANHIVRTVPPYLFSAVADLLPGESEEARLKRQREEHFEKRAIETLNIEATVEEFYARYETNNVLESIPREEKKLVNRLAKLVVKSVIRSQRERRQEDESAEALRGQHAKQHGCVQAQFIVCKDLPEMFAVGVFKPGKTYQATLRFSNAHRSKRPDKSGDGRGLAIKLKDPKGEKLGSPMATFDDLEGAGDGTEQDFLLTDFPVFIVDDVSEYDRFLSIAESNGPAVLTLLKFLIFFVPFRLRKGFIFFKLFTNTIDSTLFNTYHSMSPYLLGSGNVVRYLVKTSQGMEKIAGSLEHNDDYLRKNLVTHLEPANTESPDVMPAASLDFYVQVRAKPTHHDVERASKQWTDEPEQLLARIKIPRQRLDCRSCEHRCQDLVFSPWNCIEEHRPIGGINRSRLVVYLVSTTLRHRLNMAKPEKARSGRSA